MRRNSARLSFPYLGILLQLLRERRGMLLAALGAALEACGSGTSTATYCEMERGRYLPDDAQQFIRAYAEALDLTDDELEILTSLWAFAILHQELGEDLAGEVLREMLSARATAS